MSNVFYSIVFSSFASGLMLSQVLWQLGHAWLVWPVWALAMICWLVFVLKEEKVTK